MARKHNFSAGPAVLPERVLQEAQQALWDLDGSGMGVMECSHRSKLYERVIDSARDRLRRLLKLSADQEILFLQGGASSQFFMIPMNLLRGGRAAYLETGHWSKKAVGEAKRFGTVDVPWTGKADNFDRVPRPGEWGDLPDGTVYLHYTSNNTIFGTEYDYVPDAKGTLLVCDASSDILSRPVDGSKFDLLYAGAQKNIGPSGVTVVVIRRSLLERCDPDLPTMLQYGVHVENASMYNTPNTFGIYVIDRVCAWIEDEGGIEAIGERNRDQAAKIYGVLDNSGFWRGTCHSNSRSWMNITFTSGSADLDVAFQQEADRLGLSGLKGHRAVGGLRASLYNAQTNEAVAALVEFMQNFEARHR